MRTVIPADFSHRTNYHNRTLRHPGSAGILPATLGHQFSAFDGNGNVRALVKADAANPAASAITARYAYDGFGKEVSVSGADADTNAFRFSTKQLDEESGMNYYGYRYYAARDGRWINRDRIAEHGGLNIYAGMINNAINLYDILGDSSTTYGPAYPGTNGNVVGTEETGSNCKFSCASAVSDWVGLKAYPYYEGGWFSVLKDLTYYNGAMGFTNKFVVHYKRDISYSYICCNNGVRVAKSVIVPQIAFHVHENDITGLGRSVELSINVGNVFSVLGSRGYDIPNPKGMFMQEVKSQLESINLMTIRIKDTAGGTLEMDSAAALKAGVPRLGEGDGDIYPAANRYKNEVGTVTIASSLQCKGD